MYSLQAKILCVNADKEILGTYVQGSLSKYQYSHKKDTALEKILNKLLESMRYYISLIEKNI